MALSHLRVRAIAGIAVALVLTACSLLVDKDKDQCSVDADCGGGAACVDGVCMSGASLDASNEGASPTDGSTSDGEAGCTPKVPVTQSDFLNESCTNASCIPFDNCARVGVCDGGLPALIAPPDGGF